ncbi:hypothetical protein JYU14_00325 [Simkania negevensis]|uniref:Tetratricopeptide repeat protein n=1 Tax=Simkania negevensis TaxID=83561 RepID=A0ABS3AU38_9BACT|nr:hypothetical protein [Simkania negevensis]
MERGREKFRTGGKSSHVHKAFRKLAQSREPVHWEKLDPTEKEELALLFIEEGKKLLDDNDEEAHSRFSLAKAICPRSSKVAFLIGQAWFDYGMNNELEKCLVIAAKEFEESKKREGACFDLFYLHGKTALNLGQMRHEPKLLLQGHELFAQAAKLPAGDPIKLADLYVEWGCVWAEQGELSGEAVDFSQALEHFQHAEKLGAMSSKFRIAHADTLCFLGQLIDDPSLFLQAIQYYQKSVTEDPLFYEGYLHLGRAAKFLFEMSGQYDHFAIADTAFAHVAKMKVDDEMLWTEWARLRIEEGQVSHDPSCFEEALEKIEAAESFVDDHPLILGTKSEALCLLGQYAERLDLLHAAEKSVQQAVEGLSEDPWLWYVYGMALLALGEYFGEENYYVQAIEKFEYGLSIDNTYPWLWHGLSLAHLYTAELHNDYIAYEQADDCSAKSVVSHGAHYAKMWNLWGVILMRMAETAPLRERVEAAVEKFEKAIALRGGMSGNPDLEWLYNYGCALDFLGDFYKPDHNYQRAVDILNFVLEADPDYADAKYNLALALTHQGETSVDPDVFYRAADYFQELSQEEPEDEIVWNDWGITLLNLSQLVSDPSSPHLEEMLLQDAANKLMQAAALGNIGAYYNIACLYAMQNEYGVAMQYLEKAKEHHSLPSLADIWEDEWLEGLKKTDSFQNFIRSLENEQPEQE